MPDSHIDFSGASTHRCEATGDGRVFIPPDTRTWPVYWRFPTAADLAALEARYRRGLLPAHTPLLHERMPPLLVGSDDAAEVAERLYEAARREAAAGQARMVGLAAPQAGIPARAFLLDPRRDPADAAPSVDQLRCAINPTVEPVGYDLIREVEGCLSTAPIKGWVQHATRARPRGYTPAGDLIDEEHAGLAARVLQHELDHLDGVLFPRRIADDYDLLWCSTEQDEQFTAYVRACRRDEKPSWHTRTPRGQWDAIQAGVAVLGTLVEADETDLADGSPNDPAAITMPPADRGQRA